MPTERTISTITVKVALALGVTELFNQVQRFAAQADCNEYTSFTHYNFFYSYPEFGKQWANGKSCEFHRVHTCCHICKAKADRNFAGIGTLYLLNNGVGEETIRVVTGWKEQRGRKYPVIKDRPNHPNLSRMMILCENHVKGYFEWAKNPEPKGVVQLSLF